MGIFSEILLCVDYDRTLTAPDSSVPRRNVEAIEYFIANGGRFTVNTGRSIPMCVNTVIPSVPVNAPLLLYNGSAAYDSHAGKLTRYAPLPVDGAALLAELKENFPQLNMEIQGIDAHYLTEHNGDWERFSVNNQCAYGYVTPETIPQPFIKLAVNGHFRGGNVASMYQATAQELALFDRLTAYVEKEYAGRLQVFRACARIADIHAPGVSKLQSARLLQQELGCRLLVCVGDGENDITMLDGSDHAYCPADGIVADRYETVCPCAQGAVADVIYEKIPAILENRP